MLEQPFFAIFKHAPNMFDRTATGISSALVEPDTKLAQITSTSECAGHAVGAALN